MAVKTHSLRVAPSALRRRLLQGVSTIACATALAAGPASAQLAALRGAAHVPVSATGAPSIAVPAAPGIVPNNSAVANAVARSLHNAAAAQQAVNIAQQAQTAARQAAAAMSGGVTNGLAPGGLMPVANPMLAANDPTGLNTWQGANAPTQSAGANGAVDVTVNQTAQRAILDWQTFNVGAKTTLTFDQSAGGSAAADWVVLNRVVGQLDPATGLRNPNLAPAPSQILGAIKAPGTVLVINQNGILFGAGAQINTNALIASSLEIGAQTILSTFTAGGSPLPIATTLAQRDNAFLTEGLIIPGALSALSGQAVSTITTGDSGVPSAVATFADPLLEGPVTVQAGAQITSGQGGYILLAAPQVTNSGVLTSSQGQVSLVSGRLVTLTPSNGTADGANNPDIRGLIVKSFAGAEVPVGAAPVPVDGVENTAAGLIQSPEGYVSLTSTDTGSVINAGVITATTSVARNGFIQIGGANIDLRPTSVIAITPDDDGSIPQDPNSLADFKSSRIDIGLIEGGGVITPGANINLSSGSLIYAPNANINIGAGPGLPVEGVSLSSRVFIDTGAVIDASGLKDVQVSSTSQLVTISPVTPNDTNDTPPLRNVLDHATVTIDPRLSGVRSDGVAWVGSPLLPAQAYAEQVGVSASQLMTKGGNVVIGASPPDGPASMAPDVIIKPGATIDISGGWITFQAGKVQTTELISPSGALVNIGDASPDQTYLGVYNGYSVSQPRFGITNTYANPLLSGGYFEAAYTQGSQAGSLTIKSSQPTLEGTIYADAFPGPVQVQTAQIGTATSTVYGDQRDLQAVGSQLPVGGFLMVMEANVLDQLAGGDVDIINGPTPTTTAGLSFGQTISIGGDPAATPPRPASSIVPAPERGILTLSAPALSAMGLGQFSVLTSGALTVEAGADVTLAPGGVFSAVTGRAITVNGAITASSGTISLQTVTSASGSMFNPAAAVAGDYDVTVNGQLSAAGLWTNDFGATTAIRGPAYINGGAVDIQVAAREDLIGTGPDGKGAIATVADTVAGAAPTSTVDISGSILVDATGALIDVSAGGYVSPNGTLNLTAKGGSVSLINDTLYFPLALETPSITLNSGAIAGFRVNGVLDPNSQIPYLPINPGDITARVAIGDGTIRGYGFAGGGTFSLTTPSLAFSDGVAASGTNLPLDFFSKAGFGAYDITSYATDLVTNTFNNGFGGYNAVLATQVLTVQAGQTLNLTQTGYSTHLTGDQIAGLRGLTSGGQVSSVVTPGIEPDLYDQRPVSLTFGGLIELKVAAGGQVVGAPGAALTASQLDNEGSIRLPGGTLAQSETLPETYAGLDVTGAKTAFFSAPSLANIFSINPDGSIDENAPSLADPTQTNAQLAAGSFIYLAGDLPAGVGLKLGAGSVTDLSGAVLVNRHAPGVTDGRQVVVGTVLDGGVLQSAAANANPSATVLFPVSTFETGAAFGVLNTLSQQPGLALSAAPGARINLSGASGVFDQLTSSGRYVQAPQWSNGGALTLGAGGTLTGAVITAQGGAAQAAGGVLTVPNLVLTAVDPATPTLNALSAQQIEAAGFGSLVVQGDLSTAGGPVDLTLDQGFYLTGAPASTVLAINAFTNGAFVSQASLYPTVSVAGSLQINAPYIALDGAYQLLNSSTYASNPATVATGSVTFNAQALDVTGAVLFDQSVANVTLRSAGDLRFTGVEPYAVKGLNPAPSLMGQLAVNGNLNLTAAQVYATTGSSFAVTSTADAGTITFGATSATPPAAPYSAGSNLLVQAAHIVQDGVLRAPLGSLTLGSNTPLVLSQTGNAITFAPATQSVSLGSGSVTSVSTDGLSIPYGTTTDQIEYFFSPTNANPLTAPPAGMLTIGGQSITAAAGATVNLGGGGDVFAYEFIPGTGGSRDILSQFNTDAFTSNGGYQFPDHRQVYAIVPGLSNAPQAAYDPIYSSNYSPLYSSSDAGKRVYLNGGQGLAAGWYTLLPAQYAVLPGGMEVVEETGAVTVPVGGSSVLADGVLQTTGVFGGLGGTMQSTPHVFDVKSTAVINTYSDIALTSADSYFASQASASGNLAPRLPIDAGRLVLNPGVNLDLSAAFQTAPGQGGQGAEVDITGAAIAVVAQAGSATPGTIQLSADQLTNLKAQSLLIGGVRTDNADGTTLLAITAQQITVSNDAAHPLSGPDILLAVDGSASGITLNDGAVLTASGMAPTSQTRAFVVDGAAGGQTAQGAFVRVSSGAERLITRTDPQATDAPSLLSIGAATLTGTSVLLDSSGGFTLSPSAGLSASNIALDAASIAFAPSAEGLGGLVITPGLAASLGKAASLTLRSPSVIGFASASYGFNGLNLDTPGVAVSDAAGQVSITAQAVQVQNSALDAGACAVGGALACGAGQLVLNAQSLAFGDGAFRIYGAGQGVNLSAPGGIVFQGQGALDVGAAPLAIETSFLGDGAKAPLTVGAPAALPSLAITTTGAITLTNPGAVAAPRVAGAPGATLTLAGQSLDITGVDVRATAGVLTLTSATGIHLGAGATLETPGYSKAFGDAADPFSVNAPGGLLTLNALNGDILLDPNSTLSVGGGAGNAGSLTLNAGQGRVSFGGTLNAAAPAGGAGFSLKEVGAFDLTGFETATQGAFNGDLLVEAGAGDLVLANGLTVKATSVGLTADGGRVDIAGTIDVSGVNGGAVSLFGASGVTLESSALIAARASGYGPTDTRQAKGGQVTLGTIGSGALIVASGAVIDVSAAQTTPRIVEGEEQGLVTYNYVAADTGGTVTLRAPVSGADAAETVNVTFAGTIKGADSVVLEGFKPFDLRAIAASGQFSGVTVAPNGAAILNATDSVAGLPNFLADKAPGTVVDFVQTFDVSADYGALGGLASQANFHARPGIELDYQGDVTLASNWNLGAGQVNVAGAVAAGLMVADPGIAGAFAVKPGAEGAVFANYTTLTYRVGGNVLGEPGMLTIKAGGQLNINGSVTDGFFTFGDQTDPAYLSNLGGGSKTFNGVFSPTGSTSLALNFSTTGLGSVQNTSSATAMIPYDAAANTPGALGSGTANAGDPIGSAEMFPLVQTGAGTRPVDSWSYQLTGGAAVGSANPLRVQPGAAGGVTVLGSRSYQYGGTAAGSLSDTLLFKVGTQQVSADQWLAAELAANPNLTANSSITITLSSAPTAAGTVLKSTAVSYFKPFAGQFTFAGPATSPTSVKTTLALASGFLQAVAAEWPTLKASYKAPTTTNPTITVAASNLIRTGTGSISLAAAGDIDLSNGATPTYINLTNGKQTDAADGYQQGGAAVYTAGALVAPGRVTALDTATGAQVTLDPSAFETLGGDVGVLAYGYGAFKLGTGAQGVAGILVANPVYAQGGGDVSLNAGGDVLGRRDALTEARVLAADSGTGSAIDPGAVGPAFVGWYDQPWRMGMVGAANTPASTNIQVNPGLFTEGAGTLGGGGVTVIAGGKVSDLTVVADTTLTTGTATGTVVGGQVSQGLLTFGGGNIKIAAGGDLLGGRVDLASGVAAITAGGAVQSAGAVVLDTPGGLQSVDNTLRLRLTDGTVDLTAHDDVSLQGIAALGVHNPSGQEAVTDPRVVSNAFAGNFYSQQAGVSVVTDGSVALANTGADVLAAEDAGAKVLTGASRVTAVLPGALTVVGLQGDVNLNTAGEAETVVMVPTATGALTLAAGADIAPVTLAMLDSQPGYMDAFPAVLPNTSIGQLQAQHDPNVPHRDDPVPNRIYAGVDIDGLVLSVPKQTRIGAGRDIVNMMFFGQNLNSGDITRIVAGRDITATTQLTNAATFPGGVFTTTPDQESTLQGNTFVLGGPGSLMLEAGRNLGPFLTSATIDGSLAITGGSAGQESFAGGVITVGNSWNPYLGSQGANIDVEFGVAKGQDFAALTNYYLNPANMASLPDYLFNETLNGNNVYVPDKSQPIYAPKLIAFMQAIQPGITTYDQAYAAFAALPPLQQRPFLLQVYFNELSLTSVPGPTLDQYQRGYQAVNLLFPSSLGYTANNLSGGSNGANAQVQTGSLDLRLAAIETQYGGNIDILGPGGRVLAGSTVATAQQAARRFSDAALLYSGNPQLTPTGSLVADTGASAVNPIVGIPAGYEGVISLRGGAISTFTDGDFVLNQSRLFTEQGGDIIMWSSNGDLNAGQGPKTSSNFPPVVVKIDADALSQLDQSTAVTGAGIAGFQPAPGIPAPDVFLIAPRGTVDAGAAGVRVAGDLFVAALHVANADNFTVAGTAIGLPPASTTVQVAPQTAAAGASAIQAAQAAVASTAAPPERSVITVDVLGFGDAPSP